MPSILVELGFISTPEEERYLNTETGTTTLANGIFRAFLTYKREQEIRLNGSSNTIFRKMYPSPLKQKVAQPQLYLKREMRLKQRAAKPLNVRKGQKMQPFPKQSRVVLCLRYRYSHLHVL